jgi:hypothetical protein
VFDGFLFKSKPTPALWVGPRSTGVSLTHAYSAIWVAAPNDPLEYVVMLNNNKFKYRHLRDIQTERDAAIEQNMNPDTRNEAEYSINLQEVCSSEDEIIEPEVDTFYRVYKRAEPRTIIDEVHSSGVEIYYYIRKCPILNSENIEQQEKEIKSFMKDRDNYMKLYGDIFRDDTQCIFLFKEQAGNIMYLPSYNFQDRLSKTYWKQYDKSKDYITNKFLEKDETGKGVSRYSEITEETVSREILKFEKFVENAMKIQTDDSKSKIQFNEVRKTYDKKKMSTKPGELDDYFKTALHHLSQHFRDVCKQVTFAIANSDNRLNVPHIRVVRNNHSASMSIVKTSKSLSDTNDVLVKTIYAGESSPDPDFEKYVESRQRALIPFKIRRKGLSKNKETKNVRYVDFITTKFRNYSKKQLDWTFDLVDKQIIRWSFLSFSLEDFECMVFVL